jgi:hypothetical protein
MIIIYILTILVLVVLVLAVLIRIYGPTSSRRLVHGTEYTIKGHRRIIDGFKIHGKIYLMKEHILDDFYDLVKYSDYILTKYNIAYTMAYGSLLGAIRHGGVMPWDDDADLYILVPNDEYQSTILGLKEEMKNDGYELKMNYDTNYFHVCKTGASNNYPYIDWYRFYQTFSEDQLYPLKRVAFEDYDVCVPNKHLECIDVHFNQSGKNDPMNNIVHDYPLSRYYSLWLTQLLKNVPAIHRPLDRIAGVLFRGESWSQN